MSVIVYTTIFGGSDSLKPAPKGADECVCFVDDPKAFTAANGNKGWDIDRWDSLLDGHRRTAWRLRCVPHGLFAKYDRVVWVDASFTLTNLPRLLQDAGKAPIAALRHHKRSSCYEEAKEIGLIGQASKDDVARQMRAYAGERFSPDHLSISCIIVRDRSAAVEQFNETWAAEIDKYPGDNTQLSLDYSAWKHGLTIAQLTGTRHQNPYATHDHSDHKRRRRDYATAVTR